MTVVQFRKLALEIPGTMESAHGDHPDFRIGGKVFASLGYPDGDHAMIKLSPDQQSAFLDQGADFLHPCAGAWGRQGATAVILSAAKVEVVRSALFAASQYVSARKKRA